MRAQLSAGSDSHYFELQQLTPNSDLQLTRTSCGTGLYNCLMPTCFSERRICTQFNPSGVKVIPISSTRCTCYLHRYISYLTARPGWSSICYTIAIRVCKQIRSNLLKNEIMNKLIFYISYIYIYVNKWLMLNCYHYIAILETI